MYHPPRGGVRGGRDQFNWDDVKADKHRENYLGHSIHAPVGRWQQGKDLTWYAKEGKKDDSHKKEIEAIKESESDVMAELLGGGKRRVVTGNVTQQELSNVLKRQQEDEEGDDIKETIQEVTKGFKSSGRLSINEMIPDDTRLVPEDKSFSATNWNSKNIVENVESVQASTVQSEDSKSKKINKEKKKKKRKKDKHHGSKKKHSKKRSRHDLSVSPSQEEDASNEPIRGRSRYRKIDDDHTGSRNHNGESRPYSYSSSPKRDSGRYRSQSSKRRFILQNRSRSTSARRNITRYRSRSHSTKRDAIRYRSRSKSPRRSVLRYRSRSKSPRRDSQYRSPREAIRHRSRSPGIKYGRPRSRDRNSQHYRSDDNKREFKKYSYGKRNDSRDRNYTSRSRGY